MGEARRLRRLSHQQRQAKMEQENRKWRRRYVLLAPSHIGCLWNFPQSLEGTIHMFSHHPREFLSLLIKMVNCELQQEQKLLEEKEKHIEKIKKKKEEKRRRNHQEDDEAEEEENDEDDVFKVPNYLKPCGAILFAAC